MIKVSVILPVYNTEPYLRQCLDSILRQTLKDIEVICVDDGSTDGSLAILQEYARQDERITIIEQSNKGAGAARNAGLAIAQGQYLYFPDSDDFFEKDMLMTCYERMEQDQSDVAIFGANQYDNKTRTVTFMPWSLNEKYIPGKDYFPPADIAPYIFNTFQNWPWNKMFRREFVQTNHLTFQEIARTNDMAFVVLSLALASRLSVIRTAFAFYRVNTGSSLQQTNDVAPTAFWEAYRETKRRLEERAVYAEYEQSFLNTVLNGSLYNLNSVKTFQAYKEIYETIRNKAEEDFSFRTHPTEYYYRADIHTEMIQIEDTALDEYLFIKVTYYRSKFVRKQAMPVCHMPGKAWRYYKQYGLKATGKKILSKLK